MKKSLILAAFFALLGSLEVSAKPISNDQENCRALCTSRGQKYSPESTELTGKCVCDVDDDGATVNAEDLA